MLGLTTGNADMAGLTLFQSYADEHRFLEDAIKAAAANRESVRILEAGCGQRWWADLSGLPVHLTGIDLDAAALALRVEEQGDLDETIVGDLLTIQIPDHSFDVIYNAFVLEHVRGAHRMLENFSRWLRPGGILILKLPDRYSAKGLLTRLTPHWFHVLYMRHVLKYTDAGKPGHVPYPTVYEQVVSRQGIRRFCEEHGMSILAERARAAHVDSNSAFYLGVLRAVHIATLGRFRSEYSDLDYVIQKN